MQPQAVIDEIRRQRTVTSADGKTYPIQKHGIDAAEGRFLSEFIASRPDITRTLEVGCAYGFSSYDELRGLDETVGDGGSFAPPEYVQSEFEAAAHPLRATADVCKRLQIPANSLTQFGFEITTPQQ